MFIINPWFSHVLTFQDPRTYHFHRAGRSRKYCSWLRVLLSPLWLPFPPSPSPCPTPHPSPCPPPCLPLCCGAPFPFSSFQPSPEATNGSMYAAWPQTHAHTCTLWSHLSRARFSSEFVQVFDCWCSTVDRGTGNSATDWGVFRYWCYDTDFGCED